MRKKNRTVISLSLGVTNASATLSLWRMMATKASRPVGLNKKAAKAALAQRPHRAVRNACLASGCQLSRLALHGFGRCLNRLRRLLQLSRVGSGWDLSTDGAGLTQPCVVVEPGHWRALP